MGRSGAGWSGQKEGGSPQKPNGTFGGWMVGSEGRRLAPIGKCDVRTQDGLRRSARRRSRLDRSLQKPNGTSRNGAADSRDRRSGRPTDGTCTGPRDCSEMPGIAQTLVRLRRVNVVLVLFRIAFMATARYRPFRPCGPNASVRHSTRSNHPQAKGRQPCSTDRWGAPERRSRFWA